MDANDVFKAVQDLMRDPPLFLIGTGGSIPYGLPGMAKLATHLETVLTPKYNGNPAWAAFLERLADGKDLETALTDLFCPKKFGMISYGKRGILYQMQIWLFLKI